ncbi:MAG: arginase [Deltaproteobacteria bacterium]|nr:arginase [Deltaproteobacteria bacterium]
MINSSTMSRVYELIGAAFGLGATRAETAMAPSVLRQAGLFERLQLVTKDIVDCGDAVGPTASAPPTNPKLRYLPEYLEFSRSFIPRLERAYSNNHTPIVVGGDHSISICTLAVAAKALRERKGKKAKLGLLWVDTHPDLNSPDTTPSGNIHGMSVAAALGRGDRALTELLGFAPKIQPESIVYVGLRDVDPPERVALKELGIKTFTMHDIDLLGFGEVSRRAIEHVTKKSDGFVTSFDLDVCDPTIAPGVCTPIRGGLTYREAQLIMELAAAAKKLLSIEVVELNPYLDHNRITADLAIALLESAVGKTIL